LHIVSDLALKISALDNRVEGTHSLLIGDRCAVHTVEHFGDPWQAAWRAAFVHLVPTFASSSNIIDTLAATSKACQRPDIVF
jgi:hypothetical protein